MKTVNTHTCRHPNLGQLALRSKLVVALSLAVSCFCAFAEQNPAEEQSQAEEILPANTKLSAEPNAEPNDPRRIRDQYNQKIEHLQSHYGAYHMELSEALEGLGGAQQRLGQHKEAIETYTDSAHIKRINEGLYAPSVLPILDRMIESYAYLGDWEAVDDQHHFMMEVNGRNFGWNDKRMLPVLDKLTHWHMYAFFEAISPDPARHLQMARSLYAAAMRVIEINYGSNDLRLVEQLRGHRVADYYLSSIVRAEQEERHRVERLQNVGRDDNFRFSKESRSLSQGYFSGLRSSQRIVKIYQNNPGTEPEKMADAIAEVGDWYLRFNKRQAAVKTYLQAYSLLSSNEKMTKARDKMFSTPKVLDFSNDYSDYLSESQTGMAKGYVRLSLNLSKLGAVTRVAYIDEAPSQPSMRRRAVSELRGRKFRPSIVDGQPVATEQLRYRYVYHYPAPQPSKAASATAEEAAGSGDDRVSKENGISDTNTNTGKKDAKL